MARSLLLNISALTHHLHRLLAHGLGTFAHMARRHAFMTTHCPRFAATLFAHLALGHAIALVTLLYALVLATRQFLVARHAAAETLLTAWDRSALFVAAETPFGRLNHTRRTHWPRVAIVQHGMGAHMSPRAWFIADRFLSAAGHGWVQHLGAAFALELVKGGPLTRQTMPGMTSTLALVLATAQRGWTGQWTDVVNVNATLDIAFVFAAAPLLGALFLASRIVRPCCQLLTFHHLIHLTTATLDRR